MHDSYIKGSTIVAWLLWTKSIALVLLMWAIFFIGGRPALGRAIMVTAVFSMSITVVWQVRMFTQRLSALIRVTSGLDGSDPEVLSLINGRRR